MEEPNLTQSQPPTSEHQIRWFSRRPRFVIWFPIVVATAFAAGYLFWQQTLIPGPYDLEPVNIVRYQTIKPESKEDRICIQVITPARNPQTGEVRDFPTPCDVPEGWEVVQEN